MEETTKWLLFSALWIIFGIWNLVFEKVPFGVGCIFLGLLCQVDRRIFGPQRFEGFKKRDKVIAAITQISGIVVGIGLGHFTLGPWGAVAGFICAAIIAEIIHIIFVLKVKST